MAAVGRVPASVCPAALALLALGWAAASATAAAEQPAGRLHDPREVRLAEVRQLTSGGENAEGYWSPDGSELVFQSTRPPFGCDQIFRLPLDRPSELTRVSTGQGRTTCAYFTPDGQRVIFSSTHLGDASCPPPPDRSRGYVWALYDSYEIFSARPDGSDLRRLTDNRAYDAEATICGRDGSIVFTSTRDGDLELYRMDADGSNVRRLTDAPGYDGGAFFSADCSQIVWRASRPRPGEELDDYRELLTRGLVRPTRLELWTAAADGSEPRQITYLEAASFAPYFFPSGRRVIFSSNYGDPRGREFDLWAIDTDGTGLERITYTPGFDGFPMFSPDGSLLAFASNRNQGQPGETDLYVARWAQASGAREERAPDRFMADVRWLADDERMGRGIATSGLAEAADWLQERFRSLGLEPGRDGSFRQPFEVPVAVTAGAGTGLWIDGERLPDDAFRPTGFSASRDVTAEVVFAGYGIVAEELGIDDYAGVEAEGRIVLVRRFTPEGEAFEEMDEQRRYGDLRYKAWNAREHGAAGLLVVDLPEVEGELPDESPLPALTVDSQGDAGIPVAVITRAAGAPLLAGGREVRLAVELDVGHQSTDNVVGRLAAGAPEPLAGTVVVGAHYDHLGLGGTGSLAPDVNEPHNGADDNASGTAAVLEAARILVERRQELARPVYLVAFSGEETGVLGSTNFTRDPPAELDLGAVVAMVNLDMVGRLRGNRLSILGGESAAEWKGLVEPACARVGIECTLGGDGYGPSDQTPFYAAGVPVLHLFSGAHDDYHKPSDDAIEINAAGGARIAALVSELVVDLARRTEPLTYQKFEAPPPQGDVRSYGASLGTVPDYTGPPDGRPGVLLAGVRAGGAAEAAGMRRGDILVRLDGAEIRDIYDFMYVLRRSKPGQRVTAVVEREGALLELEVVFGTARRMR